MRKNQRESEKLKKESRKKSIKGKGREEKLAQYDMAEEEKLFEEEIKRIQSG